MSILRKTSDMNITKKTIVALACGFALTMGLVIILVLLTMSIRFSPLLQITDPYTIFIFSILILFPLIFRRLYKLESPKRILGWTFIGLGAQMLVLPLPLVFIILKDPSATGLFFGGIIFTGSAVFGMPAVLLTIAVGTFLARSH